MTESPDSTYTKEVTAVDNQLQDATNGSLAKQAMDELNGLNPADRQAFVASASDYLTRNGELPQLMLTVKESPNLIKLFDSAVYNGVDDPRETDPDGTDNISKGLEALKTAAETGKLDNVDLTLAEQIACDALYKNFDDIQHSVGQNLTDDQISLEIDLNDRDKTGAMMREMGENRMGLNATLKMFWDDEGHFDSKKYEDQFGPDGPTLEQLLNIQDDPSRYGQMAPSEKQAIDFMIRRFSELNGDGDTLSGAEISGFAYGRNIDYSDAQQHAKINAQVEAFDKEHTVVAKLKTDEVDSLIATLAQPTLDSTMFGVLDSIDNDDDGYVSQTELEQVKANNTLGDTASKLAAHLPQFDSDGDGKINLVDLAAQSTAYTDAKDNRQVIAMAQDKQAEQERNKAADTPGDITDDTAAAMALFGNDKGELDTAQWNSIFAPERGADDKGVDVSKDDIWKAIVSDKFETLTPSQQRGLRALYDNFDQYSNVSQVPETLGADEFHTAAFKQGVDWHDEEQRAKIKDDQEDFNAKNSTNPDSEVLNQLLEKADASNYLPSEFNDQLDMSSAELNAMIGELPEGDPKRDLLEYMSKFHDQLAGQDDDPNNYLSMADMDAFVKAGPSSTSDSSDNGDNVKLTYWWGKTAPSGVEDELKFGALINPEDPQAGADALAAMNHMTREELRHCFFEFDAGGLMIPRDVYEQYYHQPYEEQDQAA